MLRRAGASTAKNALRGSAWTWSGASAGLRGAQSSLLGQPLRKYMVRARPRQPPAAPAASVTLGGPGPGARLPHRHRPSRRRRRRQLGASARGAGPGRADAVLRDAVSDADRPRVGEAGGQWARGGRSRGRPAPLAARVSTPHGGGRLPRLRPAPSDRPASECRLLGWRLSARYALPETWSVEPGTGMRRQARVRESRNDRAHLHCPWIGATSGTEGGGARVT